MSLIESIHGGYIHKRRISILSDWCSKLIPSNSRVLDVGCGDGQLARLITSKRPDISIQGIDVHLRNGAAIPVEVFDGKSIPYDRDSFDVVMFVDVLHHTREPISLLREAIRTAHKAILIKDHLVKGPFAYPTLRFMDWVGNVRHGVALPYNYWTPAKWHRVFTKLGFNIISWDANLNLYPLPADLIFGRCLHFITKLETPAQKSSPNAA
jgi:SAM-dependent methyltransferase